MFWLQSIDFLPFVKLIKHVCSRDWSALLGSKDKILTDIYLWEFIPIYLVTKKSMKGGRLDEGVVGRKWNMKPYVLSKYFPRS